jgi:Flp pilus assembly protein CpaB
MSTRRGTFLAGATAAVLAALLLAMYVSRYRSSVNQGSSKVAVLVAKANILKGTSGDVIASNGGFQVTSIRKDQAKNGAIVDPAQRRGTVAKTEIFSRQQLTASDFVPATGSLTGQLTGDLRAIAIPLDDAHGMIGNVTVGDRVDIIAGFTLVGLSQPHPVVRLIAQNVSVLRIPESASRGGIGGASTKQVVLAVPSKVAVEAALAVDHGNLWLFLRPPSGAKPTYKQLVTMETVMLGLNPVAVLHGFGGQR